ncbi:hypothetical protein Efla_000821 [Eimeria flavescens]
MASYLTPSPLLDEATLLEICRVCLLLPSPPKTLKEAAAAETLWAALNKVYPAWFDSSVHPKECGSPEAAVESMLYYMNEFLESKFQSDFDILKSHVSELLEGNASLVLKAYEFVLLISIQSEGQEVVARFMELDEASQAVVQRVIQFYAEDDDTNSFSEVAALSKYWGSSVRASHDEREDSAGGGGPLAQRLNAQLAAAKEQLAAAKAQLADSETQREAVQDKLKATEKERDDERNKRMTLEIQLERKKDNLVNEFMTQVDELEKTIGKLKVELETEKKERKKAEEKLKQRISELQDELEVAKADARRAQALEVQVETYKNKLKELPELKETIARLEQQHKASLQQLADSTPDSGQAAALKKAVEMYKEKTAADLEQKLVEAKAQGDALRADKEEAETQLKAAVKKAEVAELSLVRKEAEIDAKSFEVTALQEELAKARKSAGETVVVSAALPKVTPESKEAATEKIAALENELDDLRRVKTRLEKAHGVAVAQLQLLQKQQEKDGDMQQQQQQIRDLLMKNAELEKTGLGFAVQSKDQLTKQVMEALSKNDARGAEAADELKVRLAAAEAAAAASKEQQQLQLDLARAQLEKQMEGALSTLKEQLQIRDREANFYRKAIEDGADQNRREQRLLASVLFEVGLRYHRVRCYCQQLKQEHEALLLRLQAGGELRREDRENSQERDDEEETEDKEEEEADEVEKEKANEQT